MADHTVRGKLVSLRGMEVSVTRTGSVDLLIGTNQPVANVLLTEQQALDLYGVLGDIIEYGPGDGSGTTNASVDREIDRAEAEDA